MNILWAFVQHRYQPKRLLASVDEAVQQADQAPFYKGADWASLVWGFASLGAAVSPEAAAAINQHSMHLVQSMTSSELCNLSWYVWFSRSLQRLFSSPFLSLSSQVSACVPWSCSMFPEGSLMLTAGILTIM